MRSKIFFMSSGTSYQNLQICFDFYLTFFYKHFHAYVYFRHQMWLWEIMGIILNVSSEVTAFLLFHYKIQEYFLFN